MDFNEFTKIPSLQAYLDGADHVDVKRGVGDMSLREFIAGVLTYKPGWMVALYRVRCWLLGFLGQGEHEVPALHELTAETLSVVPGEHANFFTVADSDGETFWIATAEEAHLGAALGFFAEPQAKGQGTRFHVVTAVQYRNWAGPWYFNIIRPFHHIVVVAAMRSVLQGKSDGCGK